MIEKLFLVAVSNDLFSAWSDIFYDVSDVFVVKSDLFDVHADAVVSPANSFGFMDGGLDLYIRDQLGSGTERRLQQEIVKQYHGELPVGNALIIPTEHDVWRYLIAAPTMRIPENVAATLNAYLAFRAVLLVLKKFNQVGESTIKSVICPGLCTGVGKMSATQCALQMRIAYRYLMESGGIPNIAEIRSLHRQMK